MELMTLVFSQFSLGCLLGVIFAWNKKVMFFIWIGAFLLMVIGSSSNPQLLSDISLKELLFAILFVNLGFFTGIFLQKEIWGNKMEGK